MSDSHWTTWITIENHEGVPVYYGTGWIQALTKYGQAKDRRPGAVADIRHRNLFALRQCLKRMPERVEFKRWRARLEDEIAQAETCQ